MADELGTTEREIIAQRLKKAEALRALGVNPFGNGWQPRHLADELLRHYGDQPAEEIAKDPGDWSLAGRVLAVRSFGKAAFLRVRDRSAELQVWVKKDRVGEQAFEVFKLLDIGDIVGAEGPATRTKTGELTLEARTFTILTKATRPLPEKWHGLTDVEQRYRQRYVDLVVTPGVREAFVKRARIVSGIRRFLDARGYLEVETPTLHKPEEAGGAAARPFETHHNALDLDLKLRIATELHLKRLVVGGLDRVYEIGRIWRNEGIDRRHNPEFTSIEFYQAYATHEDLMRLTEELMHRLAVEVTGGPVVTFQGQAIDLTPPFPRVSMLEVGARALGLSPDDALAGRGLAEALSRAAARENDSEDAWKLEQAAKKTPGEAVALAFEIFGEPQLPKDRPAFVVDFPLETSPLSRRRDADPRLVDRFELFAAGMELANAFSELNDPADQRARFEAQMRAKAAGDEEAMPYDEDFVRALEHGMPPTAGEGIGIDRLAMLFTDSASIRDVILFPLLKSRD
ncbi:lysyl-tRNA synthetase [Anaeromyxobacter sp. K]|uniref:Lysine--tRNA ligase n=2 Tax=Anaeromyxobacter TaxID=161492 RepID=SYK_ANAD2|nr:MULTISPECIES: lysine--tRNA ligase [Anaeromyxobacter]B4UGU5.1 RecName: Full=Lysine--tRNA ligase; AltName: Full=Lysyl-tRNA synthetase; Short=LysRS [Anaeromyxobacter sp. K]B8JFW2.1 RecName: Full=Lysine--tRNA ligase; AltName: Full=Lysyl-tRNA synthetase; Short=LysRS [Anaeromyxobacter dehalogenans 2CP-1]ACG72370.1 lysyl-tRNA synthetase [Anaeromyxobacter sp. K]ACL64550.1 lysyl-tRNA synthetase [Anaeromyxobacter dehalogenans 2CP-1]